MKPILIVGGGIAGLQAANILHQNNTDFILFEKQASLGGRVSSIKKDGFILDRGFQVLQTSYPEVQRSLDLSKLQLHFFESGAKIKDQTFFNPLRRPFDLFSSDILTFKDAYSLAKIWFRLQGDVPAIDGNKQTTQELIESYTFSDRFKNEFLIPFFQGVLLQETLSQPASLFFYYLQQFLYGNAAIPSGGMQAIPDQMASYLPTDKLKLNQEIVAISPTSVTLKSGEIIEGDAVILAVDLPVAAKLFGLQTPQTLASRTFYFSAKKAATEPALLRLVGEQHLLHYTCLTDVNPELAPKGKALYSATSLYNSSEKEVKEVLEKQLLGQKLTFIESFDIPHSLQKVDAYETVKNAANGIALAGDYLEFPSLQGALQSGRKAAEEILDRS
ncbi:protoporphyrinogen/coproporphyrinogen oxidase [Aquirufa lenticrescens]|uniref:protoporphyrinogen/coproporphyrinogen oxidase n=1 Tax=Aquirufa lenticrescens TaxID=2696560 RepID=UPI001CAA72A0|nr:NAD(P)/FAD-dependent oxidoreductase [Aquirufa lenticrescens]UAJ14531.1 FAD-dependent oxidoreductase [Aquirufa lenticrescens]